jgi:phenylalanyl-tRNA synthetase beta chain
VGAVADVIAKRVDQAPVELHVSEVHRILGKMVRTEDIFRILDKLGFGLMPERGGECDFVVKIPSWRLDVEREVDLIEEVARLYGYDKFPNTLPAFSGAVVDPPDTKKDHKLRSALLGLGYHESISLTFISAEDAKRFSAATAVELENPQSEESSVMRTSLLPGMLNMLGYNLNRGSGDVRLFEAGNVYEYDAGKSVEIKRIALGAMGSAVAPGVQQPPRPMSFFDLKGDVETLLMAFEHRSLHYDSQTSQYFHPGRSARAVMDGTVMAQYGQVHPEIAAARKLRQDVFAAEVYLDRLYQHDLRHVHYAALPRFPAVERDFSFVFDDAVVFEKIQLAINALRLPTLRSFDPVEIFRGKGVPEGKYSILLRAVFQSNERTLREEEVAEWTGKIISVVEGLGGTLRK